MTYPQYHGVEDLKRRSQLEVGEWRGNEAFKDDWLVCSKKVSLTAGDKKDKGKGKGEGAFLEVVYVVMRSDEDFGSKFRLEGGRLVDRHARGAFGGGGSECADPVTAESRGMVRLDIWDLPALTSLYMLHNNEAYTGLRVRVSLHLPMTELKQKIWLHQHLQAHVHEVPSYLLQQYVKEAHEALMKQKKGSGCVAEALEKVHQGYHPKFEAERARVEALTRRVRERAAATAAAATPTSTPTDNSSRDDGEAAAVAAVAAAYPETAQHEERVPTPPMMTASLLLDDILAQPSVCPTPTPAEAPQAERAQPPIPFTPVWEIFPSQP